MLSRDELVARGIEARDISNACRRQKGPWIYKAKIKSGRRATINTEVQACNIDHLNGMMVEEHARQNEVLNVYAISRVMKASLRSQKEDI